MAVTGNELMTATRDAEHSARNEAEFRAVCSRAYYAIFQDGNSFHENLSSQGLLPDKAVGGMHSRLIQQLITPSIPRSSPLFNKSLSIGYLMKSLYAKRIKADYDRSLDIDKPVATSAVAEAERILAVIEELIVNQSVAGEILAAPASQPAVAIAETPQPASTTRPSLTRIK